MASMISAQTTIPQLLADRPDLRWVLDQHGLRGCGGPAGPPETLAFFARAHGVPLDQLLVELNGLAAETPADSPHPPQPAAKPEDAIYRRFFLAGIAATLTAGAAWGALLLLRIAGRGSFTSLSIFEINAHAQAQIYGWVGLFVLGFAYQAFPRFWKTELASPRLAFLSFPLLAGGLALRAVAEPLHSNSIFAALALLGGAVEVAAVVLFAWVILRTLRSAPPPREISQRYIAAAAVWFVVGAFFDLFHLARLLAAPTREALLAQVATFQFPLRDLQIHGLAMMMIFGVSLRYLPAILGLAQPNQRLARALWLPLQLGIAGETVAFIGFLKTREPVWAAALAGATLLLAGSAALFALNLRVFTRATEPERSLKFLRAAHLWLLVSLLMLVGAPLYMRLSGLGFSHAWYGAMRHAITVGFISLTIVGVAAKIVPTLNGLDPRRLGALWLPFVLLNLGCTLRVSLQVATDFFPTAFPLMGVSGLLEVTGLTLWGWQLVRVLRGRIQPESLPLHQAGEISPEDRVGAVLAAHPELLGVFRSFGFTPLDNPVLRATVARTVSLRQACALRSVDLGALLLSLNTARARNR